jgi:replicative DNA helicase
MTLPDRHDPPHNFEIEQALLGAILSNNATYLAVSEIVRAQHFADPLHAKLFDWVAHLIECGQAVNAVVLKSYVEHDQDMVTAGGTGYLAGLLAASVHAIDATGLARMVSDLYRRRKLIDLGQKITARVYALSVAETSQELVEEAERELLDLADEGQSEGGFKSYGDVVEKTMMLAEAAYSRAGNLTGLTTGLEGLDCVLGGLRAGELIVLAGRPAMGKSALGANIAINAARAQADEAGAVVGFFSLEMSDDQVMNRILAERANVPSHRVRQGQLSSAEFERFLSAGLEPAATLFIDETPSLSISALRTRARRLKRTHGLGLVVVDYLQLVEGSTKRDGRVQEISEITRGLKTLAKELDVPVLALSQLSRTVEQRDDKRPQLADLRESGSIEQDADVVMFVYREEYYLTRSEPSRRAEESDDRFNARHEVWQHLVEQHRGKAEVIVAKHRHGPTGTVNLTFDGALTRFSDNPNEAERQAA